MRGSDGKITKTSMTGRFFFEFVDSAKSLSSRENAAKILYKTFCEVSINV